MSNMPAVLENEAATTRKKYQLPVVSLNRIIRIEKGVSHPASDAHANTTTGKRGSAAK